MRRGCGLAGPSDGGERPAGALVLSGVAATPATPAAHPAGLRRQPRLARRTDLPHDHGESGSPNPGRVTTAWTNPPKNRKTATGYRAAPGKHGPEQPLLNTPPRPAP
ncbi:hypothetical protein Scani_77350 [Streptomyces caniferus]|uniref:Uncharacterized protein n=1 Tax=Streptomyces caniferus TaxID=285557 RepID=A0A640SJN7_9ACTN|nr:hypothetical protein Scani_77350 [Streptomyces caniferus]